MAKRVKLINNQDVAVLDLPRLKEIGLAALAYAKKNKAVNVLLTTDERIREMNLRYLDRDEPTDVLAFPYDEKDLLGEIVVSVERAVERTGGSPEAVFAETALYVVHGILHLSGYDDLDDASAEEMRLAEKEALSPFGINPEW